MTKQITKSGNSVIVYDDNRVSQITHEFFEPDFWPDSDSGSGVTGGRGTVFFIRHEDQEWVLRHYYRGGLPGAMLEDQFIWAGSTRTRSIREWELLQTMHNLGFMVPAPVAARYLHHGLFYTADIITARIPGVQSFADRLAEDQVSGDLWHSLGECIARFHFAGFYHADLNAHNVQVNSDGEFFLLDWDRGDRRPPGSWRNSNLARLHRSLVKISRNEQAHFEPGDWKVLLEAYMDLWHRLPD